MNISAICICTTYSDGSLDIEDISSPDAQAGWTLSLSLTTIPSKGYTKKGRLSARGLGDDWNGGQCQPKSLYMPGYQPGSEE